MATSVDKTLFGELSADDPDQVVTEIESMCMNCHDNGSTRLLLTMIPFYKEVVLMSFSCDHCGYQNNEIQSGAEIEPKGIKLRLEVVTIKDLNRRVVKSDFCSVRIEELDFEIPAQSQKGEVTTVEGIIMRCIAGLEQDQDQRRIDHKDAADQIDMFVEKLQDLKLMNKPFTLTLEDISGNAHIENPVAPKTDTFCTVTQFTRTKEQNKLLGMYETEEEDPVAVEKDPEMVISKELLQPISEGAWTLEELQGEVLTFPTNCHKCGADCQTNMKMTTIPHFKDVVIMATVCDHCGYRTNEVKSGSGIEEKGVRIEVKVESKADFSRDVLKSDGCHLQLRELEVEVGPSALGGRFTTIEGLLTAMKDQLSENSCMFGDSADSEQEGRLTDFMKKFNEVLQGERPVTVVLDDPSGNSYVQSMNDDGTPDLKMRVFRYHRSYDQNEELGLNDMKTENYGEEVEES